MGETEREGEKKRNDVELFERSQRGSRGNREKTGGTMNNLVLGSLENVE